MKTNSTEFRQMQRERIYKTKPWLKSTGAKTPEGKAKSKMNALKTDHRVYALIKEFELLMRYQREVQQII